MRSSVFLVLSIALVLGTFLPSRVADARPVHECKTRWGSAVRSYLTKNRRAGPDGKVPANMDEAELVAQAWIEMFVPPCRLEASGKRRQGRLLAATLGTATLARLDQKACQRFLEYFMKAKRPQSLCEAALGGKQDDLKRRLDTALKHQDRLTVPWVPDV